MPTGAVKNRYFLIPKLLLRRGGKVWTGKSQESEVDFVVQKSSGEMEYYQVAYTAKDEFEFNNDGIKLLNIERWFLGV